MWREIWNILQNIWGSKQGLSTPRLGETINGARSNSSTYVENGSGYRRRPRPSAAWRSTSVSRRTFPLQQSRRPWQALQRVCGQLWSYTTVDIHSSLLPLGAVRVVGSRGAAAAIGSRAVTAAMFTPICWLACWFRSWPNVSSCAWVG